LIDKINVRQFCEGEEDYLVDLEFVNSDVLMITLDEEGIIFLSQLDSMGIVLLSEFQRNPQESWKYVWERNSGVL